MQDDHGGLGIARSYIDKFSRQSGNKSFCLASEVAMLGIHVRTCVALSVLPHFLYLPIHYFFPSVRYNRQGLQEKARRGCSYMRIP